MRPRPDTLENNSSLNSVCMSMKTIILAFRTQFLVGLSNQYTTEMIVDGYIVNIN